jgi:hypothetical protein
MRDIESPIEVMAVLRSELALNSAVTFHGIARQTRRAILHSSLCSFNDAPHVSRFFFLLLSSSLFPFPFSFLFLVPFTARPAARERQPAISRQRRQ